MSSMSRINHLVTGHRSAQNLLPPIRSIKDGIRQTLPCVLRNLSSGIQQLSIEIFNILKTP